MKKLLILFVLASMSALGVPAEDCNGIDDDGDGYIDEDLDENPCGAYGVCGAATYECRGVEGWVCQFPSNYEPVEESCDGLDNDCDGITDEVSMPAVLQQGVCADSVMTCQEGEWTDNYGSDYQVDETLVDGLDNDCDGIVDETQVPEFTMVAALIAIAGAGLIIYIRR